MNSLAKLANAGNLERMRHKTTIPHSTQRFVLGRRANAALRHQVPSLPCLRWRLAYQPVQYVLSTSQYHTYPRPQREQRQQPLQPCIVCRTRDLGRPNLSMGAHQELKKITLMQYFNLNFNMQFEAKLSHFEASAAIFSSPECPADPKQPKPHSQDFLQDIPRITFSF